MANGVSIAIQNTQSDGSVIGQFQISYEVMLRRIPFGRDYIKVHIAARLAVTGFPLNVLRLIAGNEINIWVNIGTENTRQFNEKSRVQDNVVACIEYYRSIGSDDAV